MHLWSCFLPCQLEFSVARAEQHMRGCDIIPVLQDLKRHVTFPSETAVPWAGLVEQVAGLTQPVRLAQQNGV